MATRANYVKLGLFVVIGVAAATALVIGYHRDQLGFCRSVRLAARLDNHLRVQDDEQGAPVWICQPSRSWAAIWPSQRNFG